jgi:hypothetical protein
MSSSQQKPESSQQKDRAKISLKEKMPSQVAEMIVDKRRLSELPQSQETLKFRMEIINPNGSKVLDSLRQVVLTVQPANSVSSVSRESSTKSIRSAEKSSEISLTNT